MGSVSHSLRPPRNHSSVPTWACSERPIWEEVGLRCHCRYVLIMSDVKYLVEFAEKTEVSVSIDNKFKHLNTESVAAVSIRAKVAARHIYTRASRVAYTNPTKRNRRHGRLIMLCCPRMSRNTRLKRWLQCRGLSSSGVRAKQSYSLRHELNLAQHANLDSCYIIPYCSCSSHSGTVQNTNGTCYFEN